MLVMFNCLSHGWIALKGFTVHCRPVVVEVITDGNYSFEVEAFRHVIFVLKTLTQSRLHFMCLFQEEPPSRTKLWRTRLKKTHFQNFSLFCMTFVLLPQLRLAVLPSLSTTNFRGLKPNSSIVIVLA